MAPAIIHLVAARSGTGKTTVLEQLLPLLKSRGLRVAALKGNLRHHSLDPAGKDSWRFAQAGAEISGFTTPGGYALFGLAAQGEGIDTAVRLLPHLDLIIVEGNKDSSRPKIEVLRKETGGEPMLRENTLAIFTDRTDIPGDIPLIPLEDSAAQADFISGILAELHGAAANLPGELTHFDRSGRPHMVDVSDKQSTLREARARGEITMDPGTLDRIQSGQVAKGDVLSVAQVAAVMAVKETGRLIPMAHPLYVSGVEVAFEPRGGKPALIEIEVQVRLNGQTGVEMEALTGVSVAALTIYDMCKAVDKNMVIRNIRLVEKKGGRSGHYRREQI